MRDASIMVRSSVGQHQTELKLNSLVEICNDRINKRVVGALDKGLAGEINKPAAGGKGKPFRVLTPGVKKLEVTFHLERL